MIPSDRSVFSLCAFLLGSIPIPLVANLTGQMCMSIIARNSYIAHDMHRLYAISLLGMQLLLNFMNGDCESIPRRYDGHYLIRKIRIDGRISHLLPSLF